MKKYLFLFFALFSCAFFSSCEEETTEYQYRLHNYDTVGIIRLENIVVHELDNSGTIIKKHSVFKLESNEYSDTWITDKNTKSINVYYKNVTTNTNRTTYYKTVESYLDLWGKNINTIDICSSFNELTQEEYEFYVNQ